ncbi:hypothetical protein WT63_31890 [Burkholderia anthina]|nr:hypothetical protein WT63_31890 [Burkholderia anthina]
MGQHTGRRGLPQPRTGLMVDRRLRASAPHAACRRRAGVARAQRSGRHTEGRRASNGQPPVRASATTARHARRVPPHAAAPSPARNPLYHRPRAVK